jgi:hypothetical protein
LTVRTLSGLADVDTVVTRLTDTSATTIYTAGDSRRDLIHAIVMHNTTGGAVTVKLELREYSTGSAVNVAFWEQSIASKATATVDWPIKVGFRNDNKHSVRATGADGINVFVTVATGTGR